MAKASVTEPIAGRVLDLAAKEQDKAISPAPLALKAVAERVAKEEVRSSAGDPPFTWDDLKTPVAMPDKTYPLAGAVNVLKVVPAPIRKRAEASLYYNTLRVNGTAVTEGKRPRVRYYWDIQEVPTEAFGSEFRRLIVKYAKLRPADPDLEYKARISPEGQVTARCGKPMTYRFSADGGPVPCVPEADGAFWAVRYSVRPFEQREDTTRLPGTGA